MSDLKVNSVLMRNWAKFGTAHVNFPEFGLVMVTGLNMASSGKLLSVGAGKTSFGEAIGKALFGIGGRYGSTKECSTYEKGDTYVKVTSTYEGKPLVVELGYKCPEMSMTGEALRFSYDGAKPIERNLVQRTRDELSALLGVSPAMAEWTVFVDGDHLKFDKLSQENSVDLIMCALKQPPWNAYHDRSKKAINDFKKIMAKEEGGIGQLRQNVETADADVYSAKGTLEAVQRDYEERKQNQAGQLTALQTKIDERKLAVKNATVRIAAIKKEVTKIVEEKSKAGHALQVQKNDIREQIRLYTVDKKPLLEGWQKLASDVAVKQQAVNVLNSMPKECPTCGKPWEEKIDPKDLQAKKRTLAEATKLADAAKKRYDLHEDQIATATDALDQINNDIAALDVKYSIIRLGHESDTLNQSLARYNRELAEWAEDAQALKAEVTDTEVKQAEATLAERTRVAEEARTALEAAAAGVAESKAALAVMEYWNLAFSPVGIPNMIMQDTIAPLNHEARRVSSLMTGGTLDVRFSTRRALAKGDQKPELIINVDNRLGSSKFKLNSKGECGLTNFIIAETLSAVGQISKRIGFRWYDEVVPHQDPVVCQSIYSYLREIAQRMNILIFMVDHNPTAQNYADYFLQIEKKGDEKLCNAQAKWL